MEAGKGAGLWGNSDSAIRLKFMCTARSVNPTPLPPFGTTGQRWRTGKGLPGMQGLLQGAPQYAQDADICSLGHFWEPTAKIQQERQ